MNEKILIVSVLLAACFSRASAEAKNYYAGSIYEITGKSGKTFAMYMITKTTDRAACQTALEQNPKTQDALVLSEKRCVSGDEYDRNFAAAFNDEPLTGVYLSYKNPGGFETRLNFVGVAGGESTSPGFPVDIPTEQAMPVVGAMKELLEARGIKDVKVIYPKNKPPDSSASPG